MQLVGGRKEGIRRKVFYVIICGAVGYAFSGVIWVDIS